MEVLNKIKLKLLSLSIRSKFFVLIIIFVLLTGAPIQLFREEWIKKNVLAENRNKLSIISLTQSNYLNEYFGALQTRTEDFSSAPLIVNYTDPSKLKRSEEAKNEIVQNLIQNRIGLDRRILSVTILDINGEVIISTLDQEEGLNYSDQPLFQEAFKLGRGENYFTDNFVTSNTSSSDEIVAVSAPIKMGENSIGVLILYFSLSDINTQLNENSSKNGVGTYLLNSSGSVISSQPISKGEEKWDPNSDITPPNCIDLRHTSGIYINIFGNKVLGRIDCLENGMFSVVEIDYENIDTRVSETNVVIFRLAFIFPTIVIIGFFLVIQIIVISPIKSISKVLNELLNDNFSSRLDESRKDDLGKLSILINKLSEKLENNYIEVRNYLDLQTRDLKKSLEVSTRANQNLRSTEKALFNILEDVKEEKDRSTKISENLKKFQLAVDSASDLIYITNLKGEIIYANKALYEFTQFDESEVIGKNPGELWGDKNNQKFYTALIEWIVKSKKYETAEVKCIKKDKSEYTSQLYLAPVLDDNDNVAFLVAIERDITKAIEVDRMKTEFISLASHQLRTPLSTIKWYTEMLLDGTSGELNKDQEEFAQYINRSALRMVELVNTLLNISRIESGKIVIDPEPTDLNELAKSVIEDLAERLASKLQDFKVEYLPNLPKISIDPQLIRQVYLNLLTNAIKYTPEKGQIRLRIFQQDNFIVTEVQDSGFGIPKEDQKNIFNKFFRASNILKKETDGNGLGLYLVKAIIDSSGGRIEFESTEGKGSTFKVYLPLSGSTPRNTPNKVQE